jgi:cytochrome c peroxidase
MAAFARVVVLLIVSTSSLGLRAGEIGNDALRELARAGGMTSEPLRGIEVPPPDAPTVLLGRALFFSRSLSLDGNVACVSCHHPRLAGADGLSLPVGTGANEPKLLGPGREFDWRNTGRKDPHASPGPNVPRNSPTVFNVNLYRKALFFDGRLRRTLSDGVFRSPESPRDGGRDLLSIQARLPLVSEVEMRGFRKLRHASSDKVRLTLLGRLRSRDGDVWLSRFAGAYGDKQTDASSLTMERLEQALSDYQRSLMFVDSPWARFLAGRDDAVDVVSKRGAKLFFEGADRGGAGCSSCHRGNHLTDEAFHALAMVQIGPGVRRPTNGFGNDTARDGTDFGRWEATRRRTDRYAFRTPGLLNVALTAPYGHAGAYATLTEIIEHHLDPHGAVARFDFSLAGLKQFRSGGVQYPAAAAHTRAALAEVSLPAKRALTATQLRDLVAFLEALTDPCAASPSCLAPWMPDGDKRGPDGRGLIARFHDSPN